MVSSLEQRLRPREYFSSHGASPTIDSWACFVHQRDTLLKLKLLPSAVQIVENRSLACKIVRLVAGSATALPHSKQAYVALPNLTHSSS
ncbi:hypothetical protein SAMN05216338_102317 [Bradyrhizobium sp. Rc2d]|nr:hypothetical protein SAMN05216338_102317 [Bradyrhizobium sp. Rc2d]